MLDSPAVPGHVPPSMINSPDVYPARGGPKSPMRAAAMKNVPTPRKSTSSDSDSSDSDSSDSESDEGDLRPVPKPLKKRVLKKMVVNRTTNSLSSAPPPKRASAAPAFGDPDNDLYGTNVGIEAGTADQKEEAGSSNVKGTADAGESPLNVNPTAWSNLASSNHGTDTASQSDSAWQNFQSQVQDQKQKQKEELEKQARAREEQLRKAEDKRKVLEAERIALAEKKKEEEAERAREEARRKEEERVEAERIREEERQRREKAAQGGLAFDMNQNYDLEDLG